MRLTIGEGSLDWGFIRRRTVTGLTIAVFLVGTGGTAPFFLVPNTGNLWIDAHIYFRATEAWLAGANPWAVTFNGIPFAAPPPALLLNLPLQFLGEEHAVWVWAVANTLSVAYLLRRFRLPIWYVVFLPIAEGWLAATPDLTLAALVFLGGSWLAALVKPYSIPAILAESRLKVVLVAFGLGIVTIPLLPWSEFFASRALIQGAFEDYTQTVSAFGDPVLMVVTAVALVSLGWERGLGLTTPGLLAQQPHYLMFSLKYIVASRWLVLFMALPLEHLAAVGIVAYAIWQRVGEPVSSRLGGRQRTVF